MSFFTFQPIYQERIWGGHNLRNLYGRDLPGDRKTGESWELVDRPEACSILVTPSEEVATLHDLWTKHRGTFFGKFAPPTERFPILLKILDCAETLSVQVHPPLSQAAALCGEPKTEMWYFLETQENAQIYAGLKKGVARADFEKAIGTPQLSELLHTLKTQPGEAMFLPSGRVHAIGAGHVILEIQQNSDTTYRVDDWGRVDDQGRPRALHVKEALASINFDDVEPVFTQPHGERVVECLYFSVRRVFLPAGEFRTFTPGGETFHYQFVARGTVTSESHQFRMGQGWLVTADHAAYEVTPGADGVELVTVQFPKPFHSA